MSPSSQMICPECDAEIEADVSKCPKCGARIKGSVAKSRGNDIAEVGQKKMIAGICAILLGALGVHKFVLGMTTPGVIMLLITVLTCGLGSIITSVIGLVEGIIYLTKSDEDFYQTYIVNKKGWF